MQLRYICSNTNIIKPNMKDLRSTLRRLKGQCGTMSKSVGKYLANQVDLNYLTKKEKDLTCSVEVNLF